MNDLTKKTILGKAYAIAQKARFEAKPAEAMFIFTETELRQYVRYLLAEQKILCAQRAHDAIAHPLSEAQLAGNVIEAAPDVEAL